MWHFLVKIPPCALWSKHSSWEKTKGTCLISIPALVFLTWAGKCLFAKWTFLHGNTICRLLPNPAVICAALFPVILKPGLLGPAWLGVTGQNPRHCWRSHPFTPPYVLVPLPKISPSIFHSLQTKEWRRVGWSFQWHALWGADSQENICNTAKT